MEKEAFLIFLVLLSGCVGQSAKDVAVQKCVDTCVAKTREGLDLTSGPCLSDDNPAWSVDNWVCDVAHSPRTAVDNDPVNQCKDYREGRANHFVEVTPKCKVLRVV